MSKIKAVIALGYFDGVHKAHKAVLNGAKKLAEELSAVPAVFTFGGNLKGILCGEKCILTKTEKTSVLQRYGYNEIFYAPVTEEFLSKTPQEFLEYLDEIYDVKGYSFGEDYRFGAGGLGDAKYLCEWAKRKERPFVMTEILKNGDRKISSTQIKELLKNGDIKGANFLLGYEYFICGKVLHGRRVGSKIGFPTVNIKISDQKSPLKCGVYAGYSVIDGKKYKAIINYGSRPTFGIDEPIIEAHFIDYNGELYGKTVCVNFSEYLRDIKKFDDKEQLVNQLFADKKRAMEIIDD